MLTIEALGQRGDGVADGVFVPRTLPGEVVTGTQVGDRIPDPKIVTPSPDRVAAPCPHFRRCGGCALQHASDAYVSRWKADRVREALSRVGIEAEIAQVETSAPGTRRRAALSGRKTRKGAHLGFHLRAGQEIVAVPDCRILHPDLLAVFPQLEQVTRLAAPRGAEVTLHVTQSPAGVDLSVTGARSMDRQLMLALAPLAGAFARITWNGEPALQSSPPWQMMGTARIVPPPGAFLQATAQGETALVRAVLNALHGAERVLDLFAGCGTFTFPVAGQSAVHAVEGERTLIEALTQGARQVQGLRPITAEVRDLFRNPLLPEEIDQYDAAVIDPPRAGAEAQVDALSRSKLQRLAFVSCNPVTFARDAARLIGAGWRLGPITVVDQFRWSPHIELVTQLTRT